MFKNITPEQAGISSKYVKHFIDFIEKRGVVVHSVLMMKGYDIFVHVQHHQYFFVGLLLQHVNQFDRE